MKNFVLFISIIFLAACNKKNLSLETADNVNLEKYVGRWYEIASIPQKFQEGCHCTTAEYELKDDYVKVINSCTQGGVDGELDVAEGKAFIPDENDKSRLKVQFFWPFKGDYWILELGDNYEYAAVGSPDRESLWILSRTPIMDEQTYKTILKSLKVKGFPTEELNMTDQSCYI